MRSSSPPSWALLLHIVLALPACLALSLPSRQTFQQAVACIDAAAAATGCTPTSSGSPSLSSGTPTSSNAPTSSVNSNLLRVRDSGGNAIRQAADPVCMCSNSAGFLDKTALCVAGGGDTSKLGMVYMMLQKSCKGAGQEIKLSKDEFVAAGSGGGGDASAGGGSSTSSGKGAAESSAAGAKDSESGKEKD